MTRVCLYKHAHIFVSVCTVLDSSFLQMNEKKGQEISSAYSGLLNHFHVPTYFLMMHTKNFKRNFLCHASTTVSDTCLYLFQATFRDKAYTHLSLTSLRRQWQCVQKVPICLSPPCLDCNQNSSACTPVYALICALIVSK